MFAVDGAEADERGERCWRAGGKGAQVVDVEVRVGDPAAFVVGCDESLRWGWGVLVQEQFDVLVVAPNGEDARRARERREAGGEGAQRDVESFGRVEVGDVSQASFDLFELGTGLPRSCPGRAVSLLHAAEAVEERDESGRGESASDEGPRHSGIGR